MSVFHDPQFQGLYQDVVLHPADDAPRLIFADWLEDRGQEARAEFIRLQILSVEDRILRRHLLEATQEPWPGHPSRPYGVKVHARYAWAGAVANLPDPDHRGWEYRRGFVHTVRCTREHWLSVAFGVFGPEYVANQPIERVEIADAPPRMYARNRPMLSYADWPASVWECVDPDRAAYLVDERWYVFDSDEALRDCLSDALLRWARDEAFTRGLLPCRVSTN